MVSIEELNISNITLTLEGRNNRVIRKTPMSTHEIHQQTLQVPIRFISISYCLFYNIIKFVNIN